MNSHLRARTSKWTKKNGEEFPFEVNVGTYKLGQDRYTLVIIRDISERKKAEQKLIESNKQFIAAFNKTSIANIITNIPGGEIYDVNDALVELTGYKPEELKNKSTIELKLWASESDRESFFKEISQHKAVRNKEYKFRFKNNVIRDCLVSASIIKISGKDYLLTNVIDITGSLEEWNKRVHPDDKENVYTDLNAHFEGKTPIYSNEHRVLCKDGKYKWILDRGKVVSRNEDGKPLRVIGTHTDIDVQKRNQQIFIESIAKFKLLFEQSPMGIYIADKEGNIIDGNERLLELLGSPSLEATRQINVLKFPPKKGCIKVNLKKKQNEIVVLISDTGVGILQENIEKILSDTDFYTSAGTSSEKGTGLGMKLVKSFIDKNNGTLSIKSELNKGTCISFTLPKTQ